MSETTEQTETTIEELTTETPATTEPGGVSDGNTTEPATREQTEDKPTEFTEADREKLTGVVAKERQAAKAARTAAEAAEKQLAELKAAETRRGVAEELDLTPEQAALLSGESAEELTASAEALQAAFAPKPDVKRRPVERTKRTGATARTEGVEDMGAVADKVLD